jgi:uncharacterized membrane protein
MDKSNKVSCAVCGQDHARSQCLPIAALRPSLQEFGAQRYANSWNPQGHLCRVCRNRILGEHVLVELERERGELSQVEQEVSRRVAGHRTVSDHLEEKFQRDLTAGQRVADAVAQVGGSWPFVIGFMVALVIWIAANSLWLRERPFDPYPYILLNLLLSCVAAIQAPVIMMSQNRRAARDRLEADEDFKVNLKAELEIAALHEKLDHLLHVQWARMVELQQTELELLSELSNRRH